jgi:hypothetical protein
VRRKNALLTLTQGVNVNKYISLTLMLLLKSKSVGGFKLIKYLQVWQGTTLAEEWYGLFLESKPCCQILNLSQKLDIDKHSSFLVARSV